MVKLITDYLNHYYYISIIKLSFKDVFNSRFVVFDKFRPIQHSEKSIIDELSNIYNISDDNEGLLKIFNNFKYNQLVDANEDVDMVTKYLNENVNIMLGRRNWVVNVNGPLGINDIDDLIGFISKNVNKLSSDTIVELYEDWYSNEISIKSELIMNLNNNH